LTLLGRASIAAEAIEAYRNVTYVARGETKLLADVYVPPGEGPFPGILMVHGGAWVSGDKWHMARHAQEAARSGYTVATITYRLAPVHKFPAQIEDCKEAVRWFRKNAAPYKLDPERLAGYGYSAGAHLACLLGTTDKLQELEGRDVPGDAPSTRLQAIVAGGAPCDFGYLPRRAASFAFLFGGTPAEKPDLYKLGSPVNFVSADDPPTFLFHGTTDNLVPLAGVKRMKQQLDESGVKCELYLVPDKGHIGAFLDGGASKKALEFLNEVLKKNK
jgi:acetyl esterase/lipase